MEAFARAMTRQRAFAALDNPEAWLRTVAVNLARSRWRRLAWFRDRAPAGAQRGITWTEPPAPGQGVIGDVGE